MLKSIWSILKSFGKGTFKSIGWLGKNVIWKGLKSIGGIISMAIPAMLGSLDNKNSSEDSDSSSVSASKSSKPIEKGNSVSSESLGGQSQPTITGAAPKDSSIDVSLGQAESKVVSNSSKVKLLESEVQKQKALSDRATSLMKEYGIDATRIRVKSSAPDPIKIQTPKDSSGGLSASDLSSMYPQLESINDKLGTIATLIAANNELISTISKIDPLVQVQLDDAKSELKGGNSEVQKLSEVKKVASSANSELGTDGLIKGIKSGTSNYFKETGFDRVITKPAKKLGGKLAGLVGLAGLSKLLSDLNDAEGDPSNYDELDAASNISDAAFDVYTRRGMNKATSKATTEIGKKMAEKGTGEATEDVVEGVGKKAAKKSAKKSGGIFRKSWNAIKNTGKKLLDAGWSKVKDYVLKGVSKVIGPKNVATLGKIFSSVGKSLGKAASKMGVKTILKSFIGPLWGLGEALYRGIREKDWIGALLSFCSGMVNLLNLIAPGAGTALSVLIDTFDLGRTVHNEVKAVRSSDEIDAELEKAKEAGYMDESDASNPYNQIVNSFGTGADARQVIKMNDLIKKLNELNAKKAELDAKEYEKQLNELIEDAKKSGKGSHPDIDTENEEVGYTAPTIPVSEDGTPVIPEGSFNVDKAVDHLRASAKDKSQGYCARYTKNAMVAGGIPYEQGHAYQMPSKLLAQGFLPISDKESQLPGDISIESATPTHPYGHMAMYDGANWISDFKQRSINVHASDPGKITKYRYSGHVIDSTTPNRTLMADGLGSDNTHIQVSSSKLLRPHAVESATTSLSSSRITKSLQPDTSYISEGKGKGSEIESEGTNNSNIVNQPVVVNSPSYVGGTSNHTTIVNIHQDSSALAEYK